MSVSLINQFYRPGNTAVMAGLGTLLRRELASAKSPEAAVPLSEEREKMMVDAINLTIQFQVPMWTVHRMDGTCIGFARGRLSKRRMEALRKKWWRGEKSITFHSFPRFS